MMSKTTFRPAIIGSTAAIAALSFSAQVAAQISQATIATGGQSVSQVQVISNGKTVYSSTSGATQGSGKSATDARIVPAFTAIDTSGSGALVLKVGDVQSVKITADDNLMPLLTSEVKHGVLMLGVQGSISTKTKIRYEITAPRIERIENSGAVATEASGFKGGALAVSASGAGSVTLSGKVDSLKATLSGVGSLNADKLTADRVTVDLSGVGSAEIRAEKSLKADVSGVGSMTWRGGATDVSTNVSGIGSVKKG
jgi:hypothetical protein